MRFGPPLLVLIINGRSLLAALAVFSPHMSLARVTTLHAFVQVCGPSANADYDIFPGN